MIVDTIKAGQKWQGKIAGDKITVLHADEHKTCYSYESHKSIASTTTFCVRNDVFLSAFKRVKRQSTTAKITLGLASAIHEVTQLGEGIIVRFKGEELGTRTCLSEFLGDYLYQCDRADGATLFVWLTDCTIRKTTIEAIHRDFC